MFPVNFSKDFVWGSTETPERHSYHAVALSILDHESDIRLRLDGFIDLFIDFQWQSFDDVIFVLIL